MTFMPTEPDHVPYIPLIEEARTEAGDHSLTMSTDHIAGHEDVPYLESELLTATPAPVWPRSASFTLTTIVIVLVAILVVLGIGELRVVRAEREDKVRDEVCTYFDDQGLPLPSYCE